MDCEVVKGMRDSFPFEEIKKNKILSVISKNFEKYGFRPLDTPLVEYFSTLTMKYDDDAEIVNEIYKLNDRGGRKLGLRYDLTTSLARFVAQNNKSLKKPFRRYQIGKVFRDGPIKAGRLREFIQCDADIIGESGVFVEAEMMELFFNTYKDLGIDSVIEFNNNKILKGSLLQVGFLSSDIDSLILSIDKFKKIGRNGVVDEVVGKGYDKDKINDVLDILSSNNFDEISKFAKNDVLKEGIEELGLLIKFLDKKINYRINFSMARGLAIYTGNIWEAYDINKNVSSSIGSGGRYDNIIGDFVSQDSQVPAVGISFGIVPILECFSNENDFEGVTDILVVPLDDSLVEDSFDLAKKLRKKNNVEIFYKYKLKKAFDYAQYLGCEKIAILGKNDVKDNLYTLKNIKTGNEEKIKLN